MQRVHERYVQTAVIKICFIYIHLNAAIPCQCHVLDKLIETERHKPITEVFQLREEIPGISCPQIRNGGSLCGGSVIIQLCTNSTRTFLGCTQLLLRSPHFLTFEQARGILNALMVVDNSVLIPHGSPLRIYERDSDCILPGRHSRSILRLLGSKRCQRTTFCSLMETGRSQLVLTAVVMRNSVTAGNAKVVEETGTVMCAAMRDR